MIKHLRLPTEPKHRGPKYIIEVLDIKSQSVKYYYFYTREEIRELKRDLKKGKKVHVFKADFNYVEGFESGK